MMPTDHSSVAATGCTSGQASDTTGEGLPNSSRSAPATALSGLYSAICLSGAGRPPIGTKIADRNIVGNSTVNPTVCAASALRTTMPSSVPIHTPANAHRTSSAYAATVSSTVPCGSQPTTRPHAVNTARPRTTCASSDSARPARTAARELGVGARGEDGRAGDRQRAEAVDDPVAHVLGHADGDGHHPRDHALGAH